jgi:ABC-type transporter Mla MlaB component
MAGDLPNQKTIAIDGPVTIYEVSSLRDTLLSELADEKDLRIDLGGSGKWDLAGLQLLISCVRTAESLGRTARMTRIPKVCVEIAERSGLSQWLDSVTE